MKLSYAAAALLVSVLTLATIPAQAQNARSFVSSKGLDTNACTLTTPCRTFQRAHDVTNANGEIDVLDTAGYGPLIVTKSISIINEGTGTASLVAPTNGIGINVNAGANAIVKLKGLTIEGGGNSNTTGIFFQSGKSLTIENCSSRRHTTGIYLSGSSGSFFSIVDSLVSENSSIGIDASGQGTIERTRSIGNQYGVYLEGSSTTVTIANLTASGNSVDGLQTTNGSTLLLRDSTATANGAAGLQLATSSRAFLTRNLFARNTYGVFWVDGGVIGYSYGDNAINWNTHDLQNGSFTAVPLQ